MKKSIFLWILGIVIFTGVAMAGYSFQSENLKKSYSGGDSIQGTINLSLSNEPSNSTVSSNFDGQISLLDLLEANGFSEGDEFDCSFSDCFENYVQGQQTGSVVLTNGENVAAIVVQGQDFQDFQEVSFNVKSSLGSSCFNPLKLDILGNGNDFLSGNSYTNEECFTKKYGCFETDVGGYTNAIIPSTGQYCNKITLPEGPAYKIGAKVTKGSTYSELKMSLLDLNGNNLGSCILPNLTQSSQEVGCIVPFGFSESRDYFVCIQAQSSSDYKIRTEFHNPCGTDAPGTGTGVADYEIFATNMKFSSPEITVNDSTFSQVTGLDLKNYLKDYIFDNYDGKCGTGCVIPLKLIGSNQEVSFNNVNVNYNVAGAQGLSTNKIYEVKVQPAKISSDVLQIDIGKAGFSIPFDSDDNELELFLENSKILSTKINVTNSFNFDIKPKFVSFGKTNTFEILSEDNISSVTWNFGDGSSEISLGKSISHHYDVSGLFDLEASVVKENGEKSTKTFKIIVGDANESAFNTLNLYENRLNNIQANLSTRPLWIQDAIKNNLKLNETNKTLYSLQNLYNNATNDSEYEAIMLDLIDLNVPYQVSTGTSGSLPISVGFNNINVNYIESISSDDVDDESLKNKIAGWMNQKMNGQISFNDVLVSYDTGNEVIMTIFKVDINPKETLGKAYFILDFVPAQIVFSQTYGEKPISSGTYFEIGSKKTIEFAVLDKVLPEDLGIYVSPSVQELGSFEPLVSCDFDRKCESALGENATNCPNDCRPYGIAIILFSIIVLIGILVFIGMRLWYKRNYENSLFKKRSDLINIINFVKSNRDAGVSDSKIKSSLKKAGWKGEQINYVLKKVKSSIIKNNS